MASCPFDVCQVKTLLLVHLAYLHSSRAERLPFKPIEVLRRFDSRRFHPGSLNPNRGADD